MNAEFQPPPRDVDPVSGLPTRTPFVQQLAREVTRARAADEDLALILCDVSRFKAVNDGLGPALGDRLIGRMATRLRTIAPEATTIGRVSGDSFAILLRDAEAASVVCARLSEFFSRPFAISGHVVTLSTYAGVARLKAHADDAASLLHAADIALHHAQQVGEERFAVFAPTMREAARTRHDVETDLRSALVVEQYEMQRAYRCEQFALAYQPKVCLRGGGLTGFEALLRWRHPTRGLVSPAAFIPIAEDAGLIDVLGEWALRIACSDAAAWAAPVKVAVNVSPLQLKNGPLLLQAIEDALADSGLPPQRLEIEVTESALVDDAVGVLEAVRAMGVGLALDDFGTGYSSLSRLSRFPFDTLKIDKAFVDDLTPEGGGDWMIRAIVGLSDGLSMTTVVEGVEEEWQRARLAAAGCDQLQGYLESPPLAAAAAAAYAAAHIANPISLEAAE